MHIGQFNVCLTENALFSSFPDFSSLFFYLSSLILLGKPHISILPTRNVNCTFGGGGGGEAWRLWRFSVTRGKIRYFC